MSHAILMIINAWKYVLFCLLSFSMITKASSAKILIEKEVNWTHPVLDIFKNHGISLSKIRYFNDGTCPVFYVDFKTSPKEHNFNNTYAAILKANFNFPYALVDKKHGVMVDVGWSYDNPSKINVHMGKIFTTPDCNEGSRTMSFKATINPALKKNILASPFAVSMTNRDGREFIAYLYAQDGVAEPDEYMTPDGQIKKTTRTSGHFYIYLYDKIHDRFLPNKIAPFYSLGGFSMRPGRTDFTVLRSKKKNQSDVLLIGVFVNSNGNQYQAYGFTDSLTALKKYTFVEKEEKSFTFYGRLSSYKNIIHAYNKHENIDEDEKIRGRIEQFLFEVSDRPNEVTISLLD